MGRRGQLKSGVPLKVRVTSVDPTGAGRARHADGRDVRVPGVLPTEEVDAQIVHVRRDGVHFGRLKRVVAASPNRVDPVCPHFLRCGGCDFLHADLAWQHAWKRQRVADALGRSVDEVDPVRASSDSLGYRCWVKLVRGPGDRLGSYAPRSHDVVDMVGCRVHAPVAEGIADEVRRVLPAIGSPAFRYLLIRVSASDARAVVTLVVRRSERAATAPLVSHLADLTAVAQVRLHINDDPGDALLTNQPDEVAYDDGHPVVERSLPGAQTLASGAFSQVNPKAAAVLYRRVAETIAPDGAEVVDLYAGSGGIALTLLAAGAARVTAVESHPAAVRAARTSVEAAGWADRFEAHAMTVETALEALPLAASKLIVNPPRKGLGPLAAAGLAARPWRRLVYVSCNPDTLARDIAQLGGRILSVTPVDLFPQTRHVETVLTLER